jgi:hypothetical protein
MLIRFISNYRRIALQASHSSLHPVKAVTFKKLLQFETKF